MRQMEKGQVERILKRKLMKTSSEFESFSRTNTFRLSICIYFLIFNNLKAFILSH